MLERANHLKISPAIPTNPPAMAAPAEALYQAGVPPGAIGSALSRMVYRTDFPLTQDFIQLAIDALN